MSTAGRARSSSWRRRRTRSRCSGARVPVSVGSWASGEGEGLGLGGRRAAGELVGAGLGRGVEGVVELVLAVDLHADVDGVRREHQEHQGQQGHQDRHHARLVALAPGAGACSSHSTLIWVFCARVIDVAEQRADERGDPGVGVGDLDDRGRARRPPARRRWPTVALQAVPSGFLQSIVIVGRCWWSGRDTVRPGWGRRRARSLTAGRRCRRRCRRGWPTRAPSREALPMIMSRFSM